MLYEVITEYEDDSVGVPLPGIEVRLTSEGEMEMRGPYVARLLPEGGDASQGEGSAGGWEATGDLFVRNESSYNFV